MTARAPGGALVLRARRRDVSVRLDGRSVVVTLAVLAAALTVFAWSLTVGDFPLPLSDVVASLLGRGDDGTDFIVQTLRLPRGLVGLLVGAAFGMSGAIFQRLARNPLASPDIIGVNAGAAAAAVFVIVFLGGAGTSVTWGALAGATAASIAIYLLSYKQGVSGYRLVLVGIGVTAMLGSVTSYLLTRAEIFDAQRAVVWLTGSLNGRGWDHVRPMAVVLALLVPAAVVLARHLRTLDLGDDAAAGLGTRVDLVRSGLLLVGVALAAVSVSAAGPIAFVALVAPQIARRLVRGSSAALLPERGRRRPAPRRRRPAGPAHLRPHRAARRHRHRGAGRPLPAGTPRQGQPDRKHRMSAVPTSTLAAVDVTLAYDERVIVDGLSLTIPAGQLTVIVGANACGKSTLLRGLARLLTPRGGTVLLDGDDIHHLPTRLVATRLGILPQQPIAPEGICVADLVARGRHPHQRWFRQWSLADEEAVAQALDATEITDLADRSVDELSGGQRQRVWIALALAQGTGLMLLDEPTTFLDLAHQVEVLDLLAGLNEREGRTIVLVLHDLNLACRYAHHLVAMKEGAVVAEGPPGEVVTAEAVEEVFGLACQVIDDPMTGTPLVLPVPAALRASRARLPVPAELRASRAPSRPS